MPQLYNIYRVLIYHLRCVPALYCIEYVLYKNLPNNFLAVWQVEKTGLLSEFLFQIFRNVVKKKR